MRTLSTLTALALGAAISAQPVLDGTNTLLVPGPVYTVNVSPLVDPGPAGADVVWDFSGLAISAVATVTLVDPADEPLSGDLFPQATLLTANNLTGQLKGYEVTGTYIDVWGIFSNTSQLLMQQSNAVRELVLPCTWAPPGRIPIRRSISSVAAKWVCAVAPQWAPPMATEN